MSLTYTSQVGKTAARFGVQHTPGRMAVAKVRAFKSDILKFLFRISYLFI